MADDTCTCPVPRFTHQSPTPMHPFGSVQAENLPTLRDVSACPVHRYLVQPKLVRGGHSYTYEGTSDCANGCGAWMGSNRSGAPEGIDPFGECPKSQPPLTREEKGPILTCPWCMTRIADDAASAGHVIACGTSRVQSEAEIARLREELRQWKASQANFEGRLHDAEKRNAVLVAMVFSTLCPYCAGTAIKTGILNVIPPIPAARRRLVQSFLPSANRTHEWGDWVHDLSTDPAPTDGRVTTEQPCYAAKVHEALLAAEPGAPEKADG